MVLLLAASLALGKAMNVTGGAAALLQHALCGASPAVVIATLMSLMALLTNFMSNNAAAPIGTPLAVSLAADLGVAPPGHESESSVEYNRKRSCPVPRVSNLVTP